MERLIVTFIAKSIALRLGTVEIYHCLVEYVVKEFRVRYNSAVINWLRKRKKS